VFIHGEHSSSNDAHFNTTWVFFAVQSEADITGEMTTTIPVILSTGSLWSYGLERCFALAAAAGFDGLELMVDQHWDTRQPAYLQLLIERYALPILAIHTPFMDLPGWPAGQAGLIRASVQLAEIIGASVVVHHLPWRMSYAFVRAGRRAFPLPLPFVSSEKQYRQWLLSGAYPALQAQTTVKLCIENMPKVPRFGRLWDFALWNSPEEIARFPRITLDTTHVGTWGEEPADVYPRFAGRVHHVHLSNYNGREHRHPEDGHLQLERFLKLLAAEGYQGMVAIELHPEAVEAGAADERVVARLASCVDFCRLPLTIPARSIATPSFA
jgi:sugar phosphate isomerase/epimerase